MPRPSFDQAPPQAIFVDRDDARALFREQLATPQNNYCVLNYWGIGGMGKSALCGELQKHLQAEAVQEIPVLAWARLDFEAGENRDVVSALLKTRTQLAETGWLRFPAFDLAFARYFAETQRGRSLKTCHPELLRKPHDVLTKAAGWIGKISGIGLLDKVVAGAWRAEEEAYLRNWRERRGAQLMQGLEQLGVEQLRAALPRYFGADIDDWLQHNQWFHNPDGQRRVALLWDTYEALWRDYPDKRDPGVDGWMREVVSNTPAVLHAILGREALHWATHDPDWVGLIHDFPLDTLADRDADELLRQVPIDDPALRAHILHSARGLPFYLNLQADLFRLLQCQQRPLRLEDFGGEQAEILPRFLRHLDDASLRRVLLLASFPLRITSDQLGELCQNFLGTAHPVRPADLFHYSFWQKSADGQHYTLHALVRDALQQDCQRQEPDFFQQVHTYLFQRHDACLNALTSAADIQARHGQALSDGAYHLLQLDRGQMPYWLGKFVANFHLARQREILEPLLLQAIDVSRKIGDRAREGMTLNNLSQIYAAQGDYATAQRYLEQSLAIRQEIGDRAGVGRNLSNLSQIYKAQGDYATAQPYLEQALVIQQEIGDRAKEGTTLNNLSQIYDAQGDYATAQRYLEQALVIQQEIGDRAGEGTTLNNLSSIYQAHGEYATAQRYLEQALVIQQEIGDRAKEGTTLNNLSQIYDAQGDYATAQRYLEQALVIQQEIGDRAGMCCTLFNLGLIRLRNNQSQEALQTWVAVYRIARAIGEAQTLASLENLAGQLRLPDGLAVWEEMAQRLPDSEIQLQASKPKKRGFQGRLVK